jgi:fermentation-respiration switch protein FrsA (DUF1100 family)
MKPGAPLTFVSAAVLGLGGILSGCRSLEAKLVFPGAASQGQSYARLPPSDDYRLIPLTTSDGTAIVAQVGGPLDPGGRPAAPADHTPTVIFFYGNGAYAAAMASEFRRFRELGATTMIVEYPGYGMSGGKPSEPAFYAAADAAYAYLQAQPGIDRGRIIAAGWSMGAAVALDLAARHRVAALILVNAFTTLPAVARALEPWAPTSLVVRSRFDNLAKIPSVRCPILIVHGERDEIVPPSMSGQLAAAAKTRVTAMTIAGAGHNDVFDVGGDALWQAIGAAIGRSR